MSPKHPGPPLKSGEPRRQWAARLPLSVIKSIQRLAGRLGVSQSDLVSDLVREAADKSERQ